MAIETQEGIDGNHLSELTRWVQHLGFESLWLSDHLMSLTGDRSLAALDTLTALALVALRTTRLRFGSLVSPLTFRHPVTLARTAAALAQLSGDRFTLGLGAGWFAPEHEAFGVPLPEPRQRLRRLDEGAAVIRGLLAGAPFSFSGGDFTVTEAQITPATRVPLLIGGTGPRLLEVVARRADEWNTGGHVVPFYRGMAAKLDLRCERAGRDPGEIARSVVFTHAVGATPAAAKRLADEMRARTPRQYWPGVRPDSPEWLIGTPGQIVEQLAGFAEAGVDRVMFQWRTPPSFEELEFIAKEIVPHA